MGLNEIVWSASTVVITLRVMKSHHAERDVYDNMRPDVNQLFL